MGVRVGLPVTPDAIEGVRPRVNDIFISWGMPEKRVVDRIIENLDDLGMSVNEYSRSLRAGDEIRPYIVESINKARVVLAIISLETFRHSEWVREELTLAAGRLNDPHNRLERLIVVRVGAIPERYVSGMLQADRWRFIDLDAEPTEEQIESLIGELRRALGQDAPFVIPSAIFAMTRGEFDGFRVPGTGHSPENIARLTALCQRAGMPAQPDLWDQLCSRYGETAADFAPYGTNHDGTTRRLVDVTQDTLRIVNEKRSRTHHPPLFLKWYTRTDFANANMRDQWSKGNSILIVDSLSALEPSIARALQSLPPSDSAQKAAVIYVPPYTYRNVELEEMIRSCLEDHFFLADTFRAWRSRSERFGLTFDLPTGTSLRRWLGQFLLTMETALEPDQDNVSRMQQNRAIRPRPHLPGMPGV